MDIAVNTVARHCDVPDFVTGRANRKIAKLVRFEPRLTSAKIVFHTERHLHRVEAVLSLKGDEPVVARGEAGDFVTALDQASDRLGRILRRRRDQLVERRADR